jgi:bisphosphoglycerate-independent phosphoglycerate mutase (AlkP superfamily)
MDKLTIIILHGWGLSSSWGGNAIAAANPVNFYKVWKEGKSFVLKQNDLGKREMSEDGLNLARIFSGRSVLSIEEVVDSYIRNNGFKDNRNLKQAIEFHKQNTSSIHLIFTLTDDDRYSKISHLRPILHELKLERSRNIFLHIVVSGDGAKASSALIDIVNEVNALENAEIASVQGANSSDEDIYKCIVLGEGEKVFDIVSTINNLKSQRSADDLNAVAVHLGGEPIGKIFDFDSIVFVDYKKSKVCTIITHLLGENIARKIYKPMGTKISTLTDYYYGKGPIAVNGLIKRDIKGENILDVLKNKGMRIGILIGKKHGFKEYYLAGFVERDTKAFETKEVDTNDGNKSIINCWLKGYSDLLLCDNQINIIYLANNDFELDRGNLKDRIAAIAETDKLLEVLIARAKNHNENVVIFADASGLESEGGSNNPLPFIYLDKGVEVEQKTMLQNISIDKLISTKHTIYDIAPTILKLFGTEKSEGTVGDSLI